jgi:hypothetical protein
MAAAAWAKRCQIAQPLARPGHLFARLVHRELGTRAVVKRDGVRPAVNRTDLPREVAQRQRKSVQIVRQRRGHERQRDMNFRVLELVAAAGGRDVQTDLRQGGNTLRAVPHEPKNLPVHADQADQRVLAAGPVAGRTVGQPIRLRPDAQVGVEGHQGHRGRAERPLRCAEADAVCQAQNQPERGGGGQAPEDESRVFHKAVFAGVEDSGRQPGSEGKTEQCSTLVRTLTNRLARTLRQRITRFELRVSDS